MGHLPPDRPFGYAPSQHAVPAAGFDFGTALDELLAATPAWLRLEDGIVPGEEIDRVLPAPTLVLGMGGSALGARSALAFADAGGEATHEVRVIDTVDPDVVRASFAWAEARGANLMVVSKSGGTIEVRRLVEAALARGLAPERGTILICDPEPTALDALLSEAGVEPIRLSMPADVGGRYSVFTAVGQGPLRAAGLDPQALIEGARAERDRLLAGEVGAREACLVPLQWRDAHAGSAWLLWCYSEVLATWAAWLQQLDCESLGRHREGDPVGDLVTVLRGPADQHSVAQLLLDGPQRHRITYVDFDDDPAQLGPDLAPLARLRAVERDACRGAMKAPTSLLLVADRSLPTLGALMLQGMVTTVLWASREGVDPYGQPAVESIKRRIRAALVE